MRTYGTYQFRLPRKEADGRYVPALWVLEVDPSVRAKCRRVLVRVRPTRSSAIVVSDTVEVARDITWFMERYPLDPVDEKSRRRLGDRAAAHREQEDRITQILAGEYQRRQLLHEPAKPARDYQTLAVELLREKKRMLLVDEVGLGKTFTGLLNLTDPEALPAVVIPPTHLPRRWATEIKEAFPWLTFEIAKKTTPPIAAAMGAFSDVTIVPYSKIDGWSAALASNMRTVIFDEAQELRHGVGTDKGAAAARIAEHAEYVLGLTATPVYNHGVEIFNILDIIAPEQLGTREEFIREWGGAQASRDSYSVHDPHALGSHLRDSGLMLGRTRKDVGRELPKAIKVPHTVDTEGVALAAISREVKFLAELILSTASTGKERFRAAGDLDWKMRQATGVDKAPYVAEFVRLLMQSEVRVVMWGWHRAVYDIWLDALAEFNPMLYTGTESPKQKSDAEDAFTAPIKGDGTDCRILIMSLRSGAGVDGLQKVCRVGVFGELDWSPATHEQAIGRLRRDGMGEDPPVAYFLTSDAGSDPSMMDVLQVKRQQAEPLISPDGELLENAVTDGSRAELLAKQVLGIEEAAEENDQEESA